MNFLKCQDRDVELDLTGEKLSMLIVGGSRTGKTYFMSLCGNALIRGGEAVHLIDLGDKWSAEDRSRLGMSAMASKARITTVYFPSEESLLASARYIANAIGFSSAEIIRMLKRSFKELLKSYPTGFSIVKLVEMLEVQKEENPVAGKIYERLNLVTDLPDFELLIDSEQAVKMADSNRIWDLSCCEGYYAAVVCQLIIFALYESKRQRFHRNMADGKKLFVLVDEFQNMDCSQKSVLGKCLTEGQKYKVYMVLATQFLLGKFSEPVISQFKQGGFQMYFRLTEEEAHVVSRQLAYNVEEQRRIKNVLCTLSQGHFLLKGLHSIGANESTTEQLRVVEVKQEVKKKEKKRIIVVNPAEKPTRFLNQSHERIMRDRR